MKDACPNCLRGDISPRHVRHLDNGTEETYACPRCRHIWTTSWGPRIETPEAAEDPDAWEADDDFTNYDRACWP